MFQTLLSMKIVGSDMKLAAFINMMDNWFINDKLQESLTVRRSCFIDYLLGILQIEFVLGYMKLEKGEMIPESDLKSEETKSLLLVESDSLAQ